MLSTFLSQQHNTGTSLSCVVQDMNTPYCQWELVVCQQPPSCFLVMRQQCCPLWLSKPQQQTKRVSQGDCKYVCRFFPLIYMNFGKATSSLCSVRSQMKLKWQISSSPSAVVPGRLVLVFSMWKFTGLQISIQWLTFMVSLCFWGIEHYVPLTNKNKA